MKYTFILVNPKVPENIGASARALKTMGFRSLVLVNPADDAEGRARWLAHGSGDILENAVVHESLEQAIYGFDLVIGTTARTRRLQKDLIPADALCEFITKKGTSVSSVAIVFGSEESGLSNTELSYCNVASYIPLFVDFPSLNLSQAVMLYAYEIYKGKLNILSTDSDTTTEASLRVIQEKVKELIEIAGLSGNPALSGRILERLPHASEKDLNLIHTIVGSILKKLKE